MAEYGNLSSLGRAIDPSYYIAEAARSVTQKATDTIKKSDVVPTEVISIAERLKRVFESWKKLGVPIGDGKNYRSVDPERLSEKTKDDILADAAQAFLVQASPIAAAALHLLSD